MGTSEKYLQHYCLCSKVSYECKPQMHLYNKYYGYKRKPTCGGDLLILDRLRFENNYDEDDSYTVYKTC